MKRFSAIFLTLLLTLALTLPTLAADVPGKAPETADQTGTDATVNLQVGEIPMFTYTDWQMADDYSTVTVHGKTYKTHAVLSRDPDGAYSFWHWWGDYLLNIWWQKEYTPDQWYQEQVVPRTKEHLARIAKAFPQQELLMIGGKPWQDSELAADFIRQVPTESHDLLANREVTGWLKEVITLGAPTVTVAAWSRDGISVRGERYRFYRDISDFAADSGSFQNGSVSKQYTSKTLKEFLAPPGEQPTAPSEGYHGEEPWATHPAIGSLQERIKRVRMVMYLGNPEIEVTMNVGEETEFTGRRVLDQAPVALNGFTLVPLRAVSDTFGALVVWKPETREVHMENLNLKVVMTIDSNIAQVTTFGPGGTTTYVTMQESAQILNDRTVIPLRFVAETLGYKVLWNGEQSKITIEADVKVLQ